MSHFKLRAKGFDKYLTVVIYENLETMRASADRWCRKTGTVSDNHNILGICHCFEKFNVRNDVMTKSDECGIIRLSLPHLRNEVFSHELVHAALHLYRLEERAGEELLGQANFGDSIDPREEKLALIYGRLYSDFVAKMYRYKIWSKE